MAAVLLSGTLSNDQLYVSDCPSGSDEALPSSCTSAPVATFCATPALAVGGVLTVLMVTVAGELNNKPSLTMSCTT